MDRRALNRFMSHLVTEMVIGVLIVVSVGLLLVEASLPRDSATAERVVLINDLITYVFVIELSLRFIAEKSKRRFFSRFWLDILAVLPLLRGFRLLRVLRLLRLFRLGVILSRHSRLFLGVFRVVKSEYVFAGLAIIVTVLMGALSLRFTEGHDAAFGTIEAALWFAVMTVVAGEPVLAEPATRLGRVVTLSLMLGGMTIFAFFAGTVSAIMIESMRKLRNRPMDTDELRDHVVICGWNAAGALIVDELVSKASERHLVVIAESAHLSDSLPERASSSVIVLREDYTKLSVLKDAGIERASVAILLADESREERSAQDRDARTVLAAMLIERLSTGIYTTVQLLNRANEVTLRQAGVEDIIVSDEYVSGVMASVVRNRGIAPMLEELLTAKYGNQLFKCAAPGELIGKTVGEAMIALKSRYDATLLAIELSGAEPELQVNPAVELVLTTQHRIVVAAKEPPVSS